MGLEFLRELSFFSSRGGCGRNGMKDSVKFLIPPGSSRKIVDPPSLFVNISCDPSPPSNHHHQKFVGLIMMSYRHAKSLPLPAGGAVRSPGQSLRGVQGSEPTEAPKIQEFLAVKMGYDGNCTQ